jgi:inhibitor of KinA sporulation pathway (predicted exonuclease)
MIVLPDKELVVFDLEFTDVALAEASGTYPDIVEVGAVKIDCELSVVDTFSTLVQPIALEQFTEYSESLTKIKPYELRSAPMWSEVWRDFAEFTRFASVKLCSWGIAQDLAVLRRAYKTNKLGYPHSNLSVDAMTFVYAWAAIEGRNVTRRWSLDAACEFFEIERGQSHRALPDALDTVRILQALGGSDLEDSNYAIVEI